MTMVALLVVMAHQSDWLSMVLVMIPLACFALILAYAKHRAERDGPVELLNEAFERAAKEEPSKY